jgi:hypothetical protein
MSRLRPSVSYEDDLPRPSESEVADEQGVILIGMAPAKAAKELSFLDDSDFNGRPATKLLILQLSGVLNIKQNLLDILRLSKVGTRVALARELGVTPVTLWRWLNRKLSKNKPRTGLVALLPGDYYRFDVDKAVYIFQLSEYWRAMAEETGRPDSSSQKAKTGRKNRHK